MAGAVALPQRSRLAGHAAQPQSQLGPPRADRPDRAPGQEARAEDGWNGLLVGDLSQPRGGPMTSGHASHQVGLDADIWLTQMPDHKLTTEERETMSAASVIKSRFEVNPQGVDRGRCPADQARRLLSRSRTHLRASADQEGPVRLGPRQGRLAGQGAGLLGPLYHFHIRISCPRGSSHCKPQAPPRPRTAPAAVPSSPTGSPTSRGGRPSPSSRSREAQAAITMAQMPSACSAVLDMH